MKKLNAILLSILSISIAFLFSNCSEEKSSCPDPEIDTSLITEQTRTMVPYRKDGLDTLVFLSDAGDSAVLFGQGLNTYVGREVFEQPSINCEPGTGGIYKDYEVLYIAFQGNHSALNKIGINYLSSGPVQMCFSDQKLEFFPLQYYPYETRTAIDSFYYQDTIHISAQIFSGKTYQLFTNYKLVNSSFLIFYNNQSGILRIKKDGKTWNKKL